MTSVFITVTEKKPEQNQGDEPRGRSPLWIVLNFIIKERERLRLIFKLLGHHHHLTRVTGPSEAPHSLLGRSPPDRMPAHVSILTSLGQACWVLYVLHFPLRLFSSMTLRSAAFSGLSGTGTFLCFSLISHDCVHYFLKLLVQFYFIRVA